jgi:hypothetical protein
MEAEGYAVRSCFYVFLDFISGIMMLMGRHLPHMKSFWEIFQGHVPEE